MCSRVRNWVLQSGSPAIAAAHQKRKLTGNLLADSVHNHTWDAEGEVSTIDSTAFAAAVGNWIPEEKGVPWDGQPARQRHGSGNAWPVVA